MVGFTAEMTRLQADTGNCFVTTTYFILADFVKTVGFDLIITVCFNMGVGGGGVAVAASCLLDNRTSVFVLLEAII